MDKTIATRMTSELLNGTVGSWTLLEYIGRGKSALVFRGESAGRVGAVKIFDRELVERFGRETQKERGKRELALVGQYHPNLIQIIDAGEDVAHDLFFVVMEYFPGRNIAEELHNIPSSAIAQIVSQVSSAAHFLERLGLSHRDIKPENIAVSQDFSRAMLLDLGVVRPIRDYLNITDPDDQKNFVGTLQYSPPELLLRKEEDTEEGWRAISFYQIGAVLHDMLTRQTIFHDSLNPFAQLVLAVTNKPVKISSTDSSSQLRTLAQDCLVKDPKVRLALVSWQRLESCARHLPALEFVKQRVALRNRTAAIGSTSGEDFSTDAKKKLVEELRARLERCIRDISSSSMPPFAISHDQLSDFAIRVVFDPSRAYSTRHPFSISVRTEIADLNNNVVIVRAAALLAPSSGESVLLPSGAAPWQDIFMGVFDEAAMESTLSDVFVTVLDSVQERAETEMIMGQLVWLPIKPESVNA